MHGIKSAHCSNSLYNQGIDVQRFACQVAAFYVDERLEECRDDSQERLAVHPFNHQNLMIKR